MTSVRQFPDRPSAVRGCPRGLVVRSWLGGALALGLGLAFAAQAADKRGSANTADSRQWPPPPAPARLAYVKSISKAADLEIRKSGWSRIGNLLTGDRPGADRLVKPFGVAVDEVGNLCVTDMGTGLVWYFDRVRKASRNWGQIGSLRFAAPVAVAKQKGILYVADSELRAVVAFDEKGTLLFKIGDGVDRPSGLAVSGERLFVADAALHQVLGFDLKGKRLLEFGGRGGGPGQFNFPTHLAVDGRGRLFVTDSINSRIQVFDLTGRFLAVIGSEGDSSGHFSRPKGVALDGAGQVYVVDALFDNFQIFSPEGRLLLDVGERGSGPGEFWLPAGITISRDHEIFVADSYNQRVQMFRYVGKP